ncbi:serine/threonine-protein phosphatase 6 regulatory ankyrin repeat subunit C-like [Cloeon dipterum]|uniref:serine/threonine-protein phosphatase 6 regulatory ankyrin repeat subunit C-like n=1 Tax=Cloeon dipterum TaxID=197152 RepID=UPI00321FD3F5
MDMDEFIELAVLKTVLAESYSLTKKTFIVSQTVSLTPLQVAAMIDGVEMCRHLVQEGFVANVKCEKLGASLLHYAALNEKHGLELIDYFSSLGLKLNAKDKFGDEPLQYAIRVNNSTVVKKLLQPQCPEEKSNKNKSESRYHSILANMVLEQEKGLLTDYYGFGNTGRSAIHLAAMLGDLDMCKWLLNEGVDAQSLTKNELEESVLHCAAKNKSHGKELARYFISEHSFDVNAKDKLGYTPLHSALFKENIETAEELLRLGADLAVKQVTTDSRKFENLMHFCVRHSKIMDMDEFIELALRKTVLAESYSITKKTFIVSQTDYLTPLQVAAMIDEVDMCRHLVEEGLVANVKCEKLGASLMHYAALNKKHGLELIDYFSSLGLKLNAKDKFGDEPLQYAIKMNNSKVVEKLLKQKCTEEENKKDKSDKESRYQSILAKMMLEQDKGLLTNYYGFGNTGRSAIHLAAMLGDLDMCKWLLNEGVDVRSLTMNEYEDNVIHCAALNKSHGTELVQYFVSEHCFDVNAKDKLGHSKIMDMDEFIELAVLKTVLAESYSLTKKTFIVSQTVSLTPLQVAAMIDGVEMCRHLVQEGFVANVKCEKLGASLMHYAALNEKHGLELIDYFSSLGLKLNAKDKFGNEPLQYACKMNNSKVVEKLLQPKCPEEESNKDKSESRYHSILANMVLEQDKGLFGVTGRSAIHLAAMLGDLDMCKWLLNEGVDVRSLTINEYEDSVLHCAAMNKSHGKELVQYFVSEHCFDVNAKDKLGVSNNKVESAKYLIEKLPGLIAEPGPGGKTIVQLATEKGDNEMMKMLAEKGFKF